ncbi:MAG: DsbA family protein [Sulfurimonadaceae bacterium]
MLATLYYVHDPMCSWCYAFKPILDSIKTKLSKEINLVYVCGGLAKHTDEVMPKDQQEKIKSIWKQIEQEIGTKFNYDFWEKNTPQRATYLACQALILARQNNKEEAMLEAIQKAYYQKALNPSKTEVLAKLAHEIGLDKKHFETHLNTQETQQLLEGDLNLRRKLGVRVFPTLLLKYKKESYPIGINFNDSAKIVEQIEDLSKNTYF